MAPKTLWLLPVVLAVGCDPLHSLRIDVREGPNEPPRVLSIRSLSESTGKPIEGANVELWACDGAGKRVWDLASRTGADGSVQFGPFILVGASAPEFRCTKTGYASVQGKYPIGEVVSPWSIADVLPRRSLLVVMKRIEER